MDGSFRIGRLFGIPLLIHFTFLIVIVIFAWIIGAQIEYTVSMLTDIFNTVGTAVGLNQVVIDTSLIESGIMPYVFGVIVSLGLFFGVFVHELAHSLVARRNGIRIRSITLLLFGGVTTMEEDSLPDPKVELPVAIVGPITSFLFGLLCCALVYAVPLAVTDAPLAGALVFILAYLGVLNIILFLFNLLPAFPMDGGRVLRAFLAARMPLHTATKIAANVGKVFAVIFGITGVVFLNPFLLIIAFFIWIGADSEATAMQYTHNLENVTLGDIMTPMVHTVPPTMPVHTVIDQMYASKHLGFPVVDKGTIIGMITVADVHRVSSIDRDAMQVRDVMSRNPLTMPPESPVVDALRLMSANDVGRIPVVKDGQIVGIVTRTDILKVIQLKEI
ncbi:MAG: CBS domain-containing protein [Methanoregulaceae archaeon]